MTETSNDYLPHEPPKLGHPLDDVPPLEPHHGTMGAPPSLPGSGNGSMSSTEPARSASSHVKGRIDVADEVVEKIAGLAAYEVEGVAELGGDVARAFETVREKIGIGQKRGDQGVKSRITGREVAIDITVMVEYGHVVMEVARKVQTNVAVQTNRMLGLRVVEVNVTVDDVQLPRPPEQPEKPDDQYVSYDN